MHHFSVSCFFLTEFHQYHWILAFLLTLFSLHTQCTPTCNEHQHMLTLIVTHMHFMESNYKLNQGGVIIPEHVWAKIERAESDSVADCCTTS